MKSARQYWDFERTNEAVGLLLVKKLIPRMEFKNSKLIIP